MKGGTNMKNKEVLRKDFIVYSVDPERLLIKVSSIMQLEAGSEHTTTYENFLLEKEGVSIHISLEDLPKKIGRFVYFRTRDDAHDFIKTQIGM